MQDGSQDATVRVPDKASNAMKIAKQNTSNY